MSRLLYCVGVEDVAPYITTNVTSTNYLKRFAKFEKTTFIYSFFSLSPQERANAQDEILAAPMFIITVIITVIFIFIFIFILIIGFFGFSKKPFGFRKKRSVFLGFVTCKIRGLLCKKILILSRLVRRI